MPHSSAVFYLFLLLCFDGNFSNCPFGPEVLTRGLNSVELICYMAPKSLTTVSSLFIYLAFGLTSSFTSKNCAGFVLWVFSGVIFFIFMCYLKRLASASFCLVYFSRVLCHAGNRSFCQLVILPMNCLSMLEANLPMSNAYMSVCLHPK